MQSTNHQPIIEARGIRKAFQQPDGGEIEVIGRLDFELRGGEITCVLGPSGSGKSTLLRMLTGLAVPTEGQVLYHGKPLTGVCEGVSVVFQNFALYPWLTVMENVELGLKARKVPRPERRERALKVIDTVGLDGFEAAYPKELSGGMKQRVGFARALVVEPELLCMDEPFSSLDVFTAETLRGELLELWTGKKIPTKAIFLVTHNIEEAVLIGDRILVLGRNPGHIRADLRVDLPHDRDRQSQPFLELQDSIYQIMTKPEVAAPSPVVSPTPAAETAPAKPKMQSIPHARPGGVAGLLEILEDRGGREDIYELATDLQQEIDDLLPLLEAASLLGLCELKEGDAVLNETGWKYVKASILERKEMFRAQALERVQLIQQIVRALKAKNNHTLDDEFFLDILDEHYSEEESRRQLDTAINWGRYAELFEYDRNAGRLTLEQQNA